MIDKQELRRLAEAATPGKWCTDGHLWVMASESDQLNNGFVIAICDGPDGDKNADYLAKIGPKTILALLDELEACKADAVAGDLSMLVRQLVQALRKVAPDHALPDKALEYLKRKGLQGSPLRAMDGKDG